MRFKMKPDILTTVSQILFAFLFVAVSAFAQEPSGQTSLQYNRLSKQERDVILNKGTEPRFSGKYNDHKAEGSYICRRCNAPLFDSTHKFEHSCGWPSFDDSIQDAVKRSINLAPTEILCANCGGHLGHPFDGERLTRKNLRNCVNSVSLTFIAKGKDCPGVILAKEKGSREKLDANKNALLKLALDSAKANALRQGPKPSFEFQRNKLLEQLKDSNHRVRIAASLALLKIDVAPKEAIETWVEVVSKVAEDTLDPSKEKLQEELLIAAIDAIGQFEGEAVEAVLPISLHLNSRNLKIRTAVVSALEKIGPGDEEVIPLLGIAMRDTESHSVPIIHMVVDPGDDAARALGSIGLAAVPILLDSLNDPEAVVRIRAARELGRIQDATRQTVVPLIAKLSDANAGVRLETIKSLGRLGKEANVAAPALTKFLWLIRRFGEVFDYDPLNRRYHRFSQTTRSQFHSHLSTNIGVICGFVKTATL